VTQAVQNDVQPLCVVEPFDISHVRAVAWEPGQQHCTVTYELPAPLKQERPVTVVLSMEQMELLVPTCERLLHVAHIIAEHASESRDRRLANLLRGWAQRQGYRHAGETMDCLYRGQDSVVQWSDVKEFHFSPRAPSAASSSEHFCWIGWNRGSERIDLRILEANCSGFTAMATALCIDNARSNTEAFNLIRMLATSIPFSVMAKNTESFVSQLRAYAPLIPDKEIYALLVASIDDAPTSAVDLPALNPE
jgi:hypothetical protein